jgi:hypothetical protein
MPMSRTTVFVASSSGKLLTDRPEQLGAAQVARDDPVPRLARRDVARLLDLNLGVRRACGEDGRLQRVDRHRVRPLAGDERRVRVGREVDFDVAERTAHAHPDVLDRG